MIMQFLKKSIKSLIQACPYTLVGKKCVEVVKGNSGKPHKPDNRVLSLKTGIKTGRNILLVGVFCPFLWYAIISGASENFIILNVIHSAIIAGIGGLVILINYFRLYYYKSR